MLRSLLQDIIATAPYSGRSGFPLLSRISRDVTAVDELEDVIEILDRAKPELFTLLRKGFPTPAAQALTVRVLNVFLSRFHLRSRRASVVSRPIGLVVDPSNTCRLACPGCVHSAHSEQRQTFDWQNGTMSQSRFSDLMRRFGPHAVCVYFCNYGEPLLNLSTPSLIREAKRHLLTTMLSTSLSVKRFDAQAYVEAGLDLMVLSIDGATQATYEQFRRNGELALVLRNLQDLVAAKQRLGKLTPILSWNFLAFEHNAHEISAAKALAGAMGVDLFRVVEPFDVTWDDPAIRPAAVQPGVHHLKWFSGAGRAENWNPFPDGLAVEAIANAFEQPWDPPSGDEAARGSSGHTCHWLYKNMVMDANGRILPCCGAPTKDRDLVFDSFSEDGDPFNSPKYKAARAHFKGQPGSSDGGPFCTKCDWDQTTANIDGPEIERHFRAADGAFFDRASRRLLSSW